jgi:hypothetical protein
MNRLLFILLLALSGTALANSEHYCQGNSCNTTGTDTGGGSASADASAAAAATASAAAVSGSTSSASADSTNLNSNISISDGGNAYASGGDAKQGQEQSIKNSGNSSSTAYGGAGGAGGSAEQSQGQVQGQSQSSDNSNSSNNSSSQSTNVTFEGTGEAKHLNKYGNNVSAYAPAIYSSSACTGGGVSGGASAFGAAISLGGAKQDPQCQVRENARILSGLNTDLAILYLCANPLVDIGAVLGTACRPADPQPPVVTVPDPPVVEQPIEVVSDVKG